MRSTILTSIASLSGLVAATLPGYVDKCYDSSTCCNNAPARLFRRTTCTPDKVCCEEKKIIKFDTTTVLECGKSNVKSSTVKTTVVQCPADATQDCLHVYYAPFGDGTPYTEYHLQISSAPITSSVPGKFSYSDTCKFGDGNISINCYIPLTRIATSVFNNPSLDFCANPRLYIAAHGVEGTETCWAGKTPIVQNSNNWAKYFDGYFLPCETICKKECTCPCPPPPPPPPEEHKYCEKDTGYAFNPNCNKVGNDCAYQLNDLSCSNRWGWYNEIPKSDGQYDFEFLGGAGDNYYSKGTSVGTVHVSVTSGSVDVSYNMKAGYAINVAHVDLMCKKPVGHCAPGQYTFNSGCLGNVQSYSKSLPKPVTGCDGDKLYLIFHAEVTEKKALSDGCVAKTC